jgi:hypothetical protein
MRRRSGADREALLVVCSHDFVELCPVDLQAFMGRTGKE